MRYFLGRDNSGHWYLVEETYRSLWADWVNLEDDDEQAAAVPAFAKRLSQHPSHLTFADPVGF